MVAVLITTIMWHSGEVTGSLSISYSLFLVTITDSLLGLN